MTTSNYEYISQNYVLPVWFDIEDIDWVRYYPTKNKIIYFKNKKVTFDNNTKDKYSNSLYEYVYDDEKVNIYDIFSNYLYYLNTLHFKSDISNEDMQKLLTIKICDYYWDFMWSTPEYDTNSEEFLLQRKKT